jgi:ribose transport system substrate-binding protein
MRRLGLRTFAAAVALAVMLAGCGDSQGTAADRTRPLIVMAEAAADITFSQAVADSVASAAKEAGFEIEMLDNEGDAAKAVENARTAALKNPDLFIEYNLNPVSNAQIGKIMAGAGVPVLAVQYGLEGAPLFGVDNQSVGELGGKGVAEAAIAKWGAGVVKKAMVLNFPEGGQTNLDRGAGATDGVKQVMPKVEIVQGTDKNDTTVAAQVVNAFLVSNPGQKLILWSHVDQYAIAALNAARAAGRQGDLLIGSTGGEESILPELRNPDSPIAGTASLFPGEWGQEIIALSSKVIRGDHVSNFTQPSQILFVTHANVDQYFKR